MLKNRKVQLILSLLIAICIWAYVMGQVDPKATITVSDVKVEMRGTDALDKLDLKPTLVKPKIVNVTITGKRSEVNKAKKDGIQAYVDVSTCEYGTNEGDIKIDLPNGVNGVIIEHLSQDTAMFTVE